jgi:hypothetical protein
LHGFM